MIHDASQINAIGKATSLRQSIITGGAGTGKTTVIQAIADAFRDGSGGCEIMAPTGKAAARLKEATGYDASTIHSALQYDGTKFNRKGKFKFPVIVDESSMIDSQIMSDLLSYEPPRLVLVGDSAQLAPVGRGQPFHDLIALRPELVSELTHCWRAQGAVHKAAQAIRRGEAPLAADNSGDETWKLIESGDAGSTLAAIEKWLRAGTLFDPMQDIMLSPRYGDGESDAGIHAINRAAKLILNPSDGKWGVGDRIIINKNFGSEDLWNGDLGTVSDIDAADKLWVVLDRDPSNPRLLTTEQMREVAHAYCLSVHKSQGSQFRRVFFIVQRAHQFQLNRALVYTAITRARKGVCVVGEMSAFYQAINKVEPKRTVLQYLGGIAA